MVRTEIRRIAQVNLNDSGGAFSLMFQIGQELQGQFVFDYYTIMPFMKQEIVGKIQEMGGKIIEDTASTRFLAHLKLPFAFYRRMKKASYDVIHIHSDMAWKLALYAIPARIAGVKKIIVHSHSSGINGDHRGIKKVCHLLMKPILPCFADVMCSCSELATAWMYPKRYHNQVHFIKNGVKTENYRYSEQDRNTIRKRLGINEGEILIGCTGNLSFQKNPEYLIMVVSILCQKDSRYKLLFIGDGADASRIKALAKEQPKQENILFCGNATNVGALLSALDIFALPSRFEGFPVSAVEAQVSGLPCVLSDRITHGVAFRRDCVFWSINEAPEEWARKLFNIRINTNEREKAYLEALQQGFDISQTAVTVSKLYS